MLFAGSSLDKARAIFADFARKRPRGRLTIRSERACFNGGQRDSGWPSGATAWRSQ